MNIFVIFLEHAIKLYHHIKVTRYFMQICYSAPFQTMHCTSVQCLVLAYAVVLFFKQNKYSVGDVWHATHTADQCLPGGCGGIVYVCLRPCYNSVNYFLGRRN